MKFLFAVFGDLGCCLGVIFGGQGVYFQCSFWSEQFSFRSEQCNFFGGYGIVSKVVCQWLRWCVLRQFIR